MFETETLRKSVQATYISEIRVLNRQNYNSQMQESWQRHRIGMAAALAIYVVWN